MTSQVVYAIVGSRNKAEEIIQTLIDSGIKAEDISFLSSQGKEFHDIKINPEVNRNWRTEERIADYPTGQQAGERMRDHHLQEDQGAIGTEKHTKAPEGTTTGALTGGIIGGTLGLLAGVGALAIPGLGPFIAAGPIMAALAGVGAGGTLGGVVGALIGAGIPEFEAKRYESRLKQGGILLAVRAMNDDHVKRIKELLQKNGAEDVATSSEATTGKNYKK